MNEIIFIRNFLNKEQCTQLNDWVNVGVKNKWLDLGINKQSSWTYTGRLTTRNYAHRFNYPEIVYEVFEKITNTLKIKHLKKSVVGGGKDGVVVSYTLPGGDVYLHTDPMENQNHVLRCNVMTQSAEKGGQLFIGGKNIDIQVGDLHCYLPSNIQHNVTTVEGNTPRIMWMFGYQITINEFNQLLNNSNFYHG